MSKRTIALITSLIFLTVILFVVAYTTQNQRTSDTTISTVPTMTPAPIADAILSLSPETVTFSATNNATVTVIVDSGTNSINGVQLEIAYDPLAIRNVTVTPGNFFTEPVIPLNVVDTKTGRISYVISLPPQGTSKKGTGTIATINFSKVLPTVQTTTNLTFLPKTYITITGSETSVLKSTNGATIILSNPTTTTLPQSTNSAQPTR